MSLPIRIALMLIVLAIVSSVMLVIIYNFGTDSHRVFHSLFIIDHTTTQSDKFVPTKEVFWEDFLRNNNKQRRGKRRRNKNMNKIDNDSNRAIEVEVSGEQYDAFLENVSFSTKYTPNASALQSFLRTRFTKECLNTEKTFHHADTRQRFPELVLLSEEMKASLLFNRNSTVPRKTFQNLHRRESSNNYTTLQKFQLRISNQELYEESDPTIDILLQKMANMPISHVDEYSAGTQLKLNVTFNDGSQSILKPMRYDRYKETSPNHFYFTDFERHNSEIAAFHLDRILGFRRCPPVVGRKVNIIKELFHNAEQHLRNTFFLSPANNLCFHGHCKYYCDTSHAICGQPDSVEVSLAALLPSDTLVGRQRWRNPWRRSYRKRQKAAWESDSDYCQVVRQQQLYNNSKRLADITDMSILDFLIGNMDRHHYETFKAFGNDSFVLHLDQGRGFGRAKHDEMSILAPLEQCCFLHFKTFYRLIELQHGHQKLSVLMRCSLYKDPLNPVLLDAHLEALDRRLEIVIHAIQNCIQKYAMNHVFFR